MSKIIRNIILIVVVISAAVAVLLSYKSASGPLPEGGGNNYEQGGTEAYRSGDSIIQKYRNADMGLSFEYRLYPDGYTLIGDWERRSDNSISEFSLNLFDIQDYMGVISSTEPRDGPLSMSLRIFENKENLSPSDWAKAHPRESWSDLMRTPFTETMLGGAPAARYEADGLYTNDVYIVNNNFKIYIISAPKLGPENRLTEDFGALLESLLFF